MGGIKMTDEEINKAVAEIRGWKNLSFDVWHNGIVGILPTNKDVRSKIPDYCNDLNAMHEAEKSLGSAEQGRNYMDFLDDGNGGHTATARQRAEAFLRTLGKWEEAK
jgi:hypothetical protein